MANLTSILNPAPADPETPSEEQKKDGTLPVNGQANHGHPLQATQSAATSPPPLNIVTSPGLDALAAAASSSVPLASPTQQNLSASSAVSHSNYASIPANWTPEVQRVDPRAYHIPSRVGLESSERQNGTTPGVPESQVPIAESGLHFNNTPSSAYAQQNLPAAMSHLSTESIPSQRDQVHIKAEAADSPIEKAAGAQLHSLQTDIHASSASQRVASPGTPLKNVTNFSPGPNAPGQPSTTQSKPKAPPSRKRAAPKKGTAVKPPAKKRKVEGESIGGSPSGPRTGTPATSRASNTPVPRNRKGNSATPTRSSSILNGNEEDENEEDDDEDDSELYCVCRKPDDHSVMIGCDGPCSDWFHTRCVDMNAEKVELISKWYCPNCTAEGHETLWKRKCRLEDCNKPASTDPSGQKSKYCCHEHGLEFMMRRVFGDPSDMKSESGTPRRKQKRDNAVNGKPVNDAEATIEDGYDHPRGGILRPEELKALVEESGDVEAFRKLGEGILSPGDKSDENIGVISFTPEETVLLESLSQRRDELRAKQAMLLDRDKFISMVVARGKGVLAELKKEDKLLKDICGYDARLTWSEFEFNEWRASEEGQQALRTDTLPPPTTSLDAELQAETKMSVDPNANDAAKEDEEAEVGVGVCKRKRCERHRAWLKVQHQDNAMEKEEVRQSLRKLDAEEKDLRDRATIRTLEGNSA